MAVYTTVVDYRCSCTEEEAEKEKVKENEKEEYPILKPSSPTKSGWENET